MSQLESQLATEWLHLRPIPPGCCCFHLQGLVCSTGSGRTSSILLAYKSGASKTVDACRLAAAPVFMSGWPLEELWIPWGWDWVRGLCVLTYVLPGSSTSHTTPKRYLRNVVLEHISAEISVSPARLPCLHTPPPHICLSCMYTVSHFYPAFLCTNNSCVPRTCKEPIVFQTH